MNKYKHFPEIDYDLTENDLIVALNEDGFYTNFSIIIPNKLEHNLRKYVSKTKLKSIHPDIELAIEKSLWVCNMLIPFRNSNVDYRCLSSKKLRQIIGDKYRLILNLLESNNFTSKGPAIIKVKNYSTKSSKCNQYKLSPAYLNKGIQSYTLKHENLKKKWLNEFIRKYLTFYTIEDSCPKKTLLKRACERTYMPNTAELMSYAKVLVDNGFKHKGRLLIFKPKHNKKRFSDNNKFVFVEDHIEQYMAIMVNGFANISIGDEYYCNRVYYTVNLIPSWCRHLIRIDNEETCELDFAGLHPNIILMLFCNINTKNYKKLYSKYKGDIHSFIADEFLKMYGKQIPRNDVKKLHLKFFNQHVNDMKKSPIYPIYEKLFPNLIEQIIKIKNEHGYKIISKLLFYVEGDLMWTIIQELNKMNIAAHWIHDAILVKTKDKQIALQIMNKTAIESSIYTKAC